MTYPRSSPVSPGQPTAADHYNHLRSDALYLGYDSETAAALGNLLERYEKNLNLTALSTNRVRVEASPTVPVDLVIAGKPLRASANVDLPAGFAPSGSASTYYVFAEAAGTTFSLNVSTSPTEWTGSRRIGSFYWNGSAIEKNSIVIEDRAYLIQTLKYAPPQACQGRLTLTSGSPVTTGDTTGSTLYFAPYLGNVIDLYTPGWGWKPYTFSELSVSAAGKAAGTTCDVFIYDNDGTLALELVDWASATVRAVSLDLVNGIYLKNGDNAKRYLGTISTSASGTIADTVGHRGVWNLYNPVLTSLYAYDATAHTYSGTTARPWNNSSSHKVTVTTGLGRLVRFSLQAGFYDTGGLAAYVYLYDDTPNTICLSYNYAQATKIYWSVPGQKYQIGTWNYTINEKGNATPSNFAVYYLYGFLLA